MKTATTDLLKKDLLLVELPEKYNLDHTYYREDNETEIAFYLNEDCVQLKTFKGSYTLLGKPDEIKEDDVVDLCDRIGINNPLADCDFFADYGNDDRMFETALESFNSAIETVVFWDVNPLKYWFENADKIDDENEAIAKKQFDEAQEKTFDRNRSIILVKN